MAEAAGASLSAVAMAVPDRRVPNSEIAAQIGVTEDWISKRTGTSSRPWAEEGERMSDFAARAGQAALDRAGLDAAQLDLVLVATSTSDEITPNAAPVVAGMLGADGAGAFDLGSACTGWLAGLAVAAGQVESGRAEHALVIGADFLSRFLDLSDRDGGCPGGAACCWPASAAASPGAPPWSSGVGDRGPAMGLPRVPGRGVPPRFCRCADVPGLRECSRRGRVLQRGRTLGAKGAQMIYLLTRPIAWLFSILVMVVMSPFKLAGAVRNHRMRKNVKMAAQVARDQKKAVAR